MSSGFSTPSILIRVVRGCELCLPRWWPVMRPLTYRRDYYAGQEEGQLSPRKQSMVEEEERTIHRWCTTCCGIQKSGFLRS